MTDFVICFECSSLHIHAHGKRAVVPITRSPEPTFDAALQQAGVPLAPKSR